MRITVRPGERTLLLLVLCFTLPTVLFAVTINFELKTLLALSAVFLLHSYLFWIALSVSIDLNDKDIHIRYLNHELQDNIDNLVPVASPKFDYRKDERHGLKKLHAGTRLHGFAVGWFTLKNDDVAFSCVTRKSRARFFESRDGYLLILDPRVASKIETYMKGESVS